MNRLKFLAIGPFVLCSATLIAQQSLIQYLPKNTLMAFSAPDLITAAKEFQSSPVAKMWREEETQTFLADAIEFVKEKFDEGRAQAKQAYERNELPVDPDKLLELRVGGVTGAITQLGITSGDHGPVPNVGVVVHIDFANSGETWRGLINMGLGMLEAQARNNLAKTELDLGDVHLVQMKPTRVPEGMNMGLNVAFVPNGVLIGTLEDDVKTIVGNMQAQTPGLGASEVYAKVASHVQAPGAAVQSFVNIDPIVDFAVSAMTIATEMDPDLAMIDMDGVGRALSAMGLRNLGAAAGSGHYENGKSVVRGYHAHGARKGLTAATGGKKVDMSFLKWVPKDAVSFSAWTWDVATIYDTLLKGLQAYDPNLAEKALGHLAKVEEQLGFNIRNDLFGAFGDHGITWSMAVSTVMSMPESAFLIAVKDQEKLVTVLRNLSQLSNGLIDFEEGERRGINVYSIRVNADPSRGMGPNPFDMFTPTFAFKDGYLVAGFSVGDIKRVFKRMEREDDPKGDIRSNKEFAAIASSIPASVDSLSFTDWKTQFESLYQLATGMLALVPMGEDVPIDMSLLPDSGTLTQHLFGSISFSTSTEDSSEYVTVSPWGPEVALGLVAAVGVAAAVILPNTLR